ncbi:MAG: universal stress protein [Acidobacteriota bacterium]|nr:universal stress protein [Acidobacteriota bacterium]
MAVAIKASWSNPSTILFATEIPTDERVFRFAVAQAKQFKAHLVLLHAYDTLVLTGSDATGARYYDFEASAHVETAHLEPLAERARSQGVDCSLAVRPGLPSDQILKFAEEHSVDRIMMGTHSPGPIGKLLVGSVAESVLRNATVPVFIVGPETADGGYRNFETRTILCAVSLAETSIALAQFAAELAVRHKARLILQHVIIPQEREEALADRTVGQIEHDLLLLIPEELRDQLEVQAIVVHGDPTEELLFQSRAQQAELLVLGAQGASAFAAATRNGVVYKVLAGSHCPVITLSPVLLAKCGVKVDRRLSSEIFLAGVF